MFHTVGKLDSDYLFIDDIQFELEDMEAADVVPVKIGFPLIEQDSPWEMMPTNTTRYYFTRKYLCRNCKRQIMSESWNEHRCFGGGTILRDNTMPSFCPYCGAVLKEDSEDGKVEM